VSILVHTCRLSYLQWSLVLNLAVFIHLWIIARVLFKLHKHYLLFLYREWILKPVQRNLSIRYIIYTLRYIYISLLLLGRNCCNRPFLRAITIYFDWGLSFNDIRENIILVLRHLQLQWLLILILEHHMISIYRSLLTLWRVNCFNYLLACIGNSIREIWVSQFIVFFERGLWVMNTIF
jgi:hypothetical protein